MLRYLKLPVVAFFVRVLRDIRLELQEIIRLQHEIIETSNRNKDTIMTAIDDLKTDIAALIAEGTADITSLVSNAASNSNDPAIRQLDIDVKAATAALHSQFTAATGTPVVVTPPVTPPAPVTPPVTQPAPVTPPVTQPVTPPAAAAPAGVTVGPDSFKSGA